MGSALLALYWKTTFPDYRFDIIEPNPQMSWHKSLELLPEDYIPQVIVFAVKPQELENILPAYRQRFASQPLYTSIAAGKTIAFFQKMLGNDIRMVRGMPNLAALIPEGHHRALRLPRPARRRCRYRDAADGRGGQNRMD